MPELGFTLVSSKSFDEVTANLEKNSVENQFRVLAVHDVQETLEEKGLKRDALKIIEICNAGFAHEALMKNIDVAMFMPCRYIVYRKNEETIVTLARPKMISEMLPDSGLDEIASDVEERLIKIMKLSI